MARKKESLYMNDWSPLTEREQVLIEARMFRKESWAECAKRAGYKTGPQARVVYARATKKKRTWEFLEDEYPEILDAAFSVGQSPHGVLHTVTRKRNLGWSWEQISRYFVEKAAM